jgi:RHS repeat-associated protein
MRVGHKSILRFAFFSLILLATQVPAAAQYWPDGYLYRRAITIDHTNVPNTDQTNFAVLISGTYAFLATTANGGNVANANGYDILFASDANGLNPLPFEQESYNPSTGAILYWVKLPSVSHTANTVFYMFYGNASISADQSTKTLVWDTNYKGVWHLPNGSTLSGADSTSNGYTLTNNNSTAATTGKVDGAASFNGSNNYLSNSSLSISSGSSITISFWNYVTSSQLQAAAAFTIGASDNPNRISAHAPWSDSTLYWDFGSYSGGGRISTSYSSYVGSWTHVVLEYNATNTTHSIYLNGSLAASNVNSSAPQNTQTGIDIGAWPSSSYYHRGSIDEFRVSTVARSADWIATEYKNQSSPSTFYSVGTAAQGPLNFSITGLTPSAVDFGGSVVLVGTNFGFSQGNSTVLLNGTNLTIQTWDNTHIEVVIPYGASSGYFMLTINGQTAISPFLTVLPLAVGWSDGDIGSVGLAGSATYANGTFTVKGAGNGTNANPDQFHFVYQPLTGDGSIVARVVSIQGASYPQAGVEIRETLDPAARYVQMTGSTGCFFFYYRASPGANASGTYDGTCPGAPKWLKLVRSGNLFSGYESTDGVNWVQVGTSQTITMAQNVYVGLVVSSETTSTLTTATFDSVSVGSATTPAPMITEVSATTGSVGSQVAITGTGFGASQDIGLVTLNNSPMTVNSWSSTSIIFTISTGATSGQLVVLVAPGMNSSNAVDFTVTTQPLLTPWLDQDVGAVGLAGSATYANGTFTVKGAGRGTNFNPDQFHFVYQPLTGDGTIVARVVSIQGATYPQGGLEIRETLDPAARNVQMTGSTGCFFFYYRASPGANASGTYDGTCPGAPKWLKLVRSGNLFSGYESTDGVNWVQVGTSQTITMAQNVYVGLVVSSEDNSTLTTATFDNVTLTVGTTPFVTGVSPSLGAVGTAVTITGSSFGATQGSSTISFNGGVASSIASWNNTQVVASVPSTAAPGTGPVKVTVGSISSPSNVVFTVINPQISSLSPPAAQHGGSVTLSGVGFGTSQGNSTVQFNSVTATVSSWSDTSVTATVPANATTGPVTVSENGVTSNGVQFTVIEAISVTGISPNSGPIGTIVTITGTGFGSTQSNSTLNFYGATATASSWSDTQIVAPVPSGTASGPVWVTVANISGVGPNFALTTTMQLTDSLGNSTTYTSVGAGGNWGPSTSQGSGCSSCTLRGTVSSTYDSQGHVLSKTNELGRITTYTYDSNGNAASVTVPTGSGNATTLYTYNSFGEVLTTTDPLGNVTTNTYDANGNLLTVTAPAPNGSTAASVTTFTYDSKGELLTIKDPLNNVTTLTYYPTGLINTIKDAQQNVTTYVYDTHGNRTSVTDAMNNQTTFAYDTGDRLKTITYPGSTGTTTFGYDYRGRRTSVTDQNGKATSYAYDDADRLLTVTDAANNVTTYGYDTENNLTSIQDANSHTTSFSYDAFGRLIKTTFPSGYIETYGYDAVGNLTGKTDRKNQLITYTYDQLNRLTQKAYPDSTAVNYTYDNDSRLTQVADPTGTYQFTFDNMGRLTNTTTSYAFLTGRNFTTSYGYDAASNRTGFTDPESGTTSYVYDTLNRLQTLTPPAAFSGTGNFGFSYDALSRRTQMTRPNGLKSIYAYDNLSRLQSVLHQSGSTTLDGAAYGVDNAGNRTSRTPQPSGAASNYSYDNIYELTGVTQNSTTTESYTYDPVGNRLSSLGVSSYTNNSSNELTSTPTTTYTYDNNGNTLTKVVGSNTTTYAWDFENRMTSVTLPGSGGTVTFKYDPAGRRIYKSLSSGTSIYAYDGDNLVEETNAAGAVVARYSDGLNIDEPLAMLRSGATSYYHADGLGSVTSLSNTAGSIANTYTYDSFGKLTNSTGSLVNPFRYTARESDTETGLYYYRARYYDLNIGRFTSEDSVRFRGGIDFYTYGANSPTNLADPSGLCPPPNGCRPPNTGNSKPASACSVYPDFKHRKACQLLGGDNPIDNCVRGCLLNQYDAGTHKYTCDERALHCSCFDACGYREGLARKIGRNHFDCDGHADAPGPPI